MSKHAPGPFRLCGDADGWSASRDGIGCTEYRAIKDASGRVIALVVDQSEDMPPSLDTLTTGNKLAAAPELLKALQELVELEDHGMQAGEAAIEAWERARAVIAKAEGKQ